MIRFFIKPWRFAVIFTILLIGAFSFVLLDTFVIPHAQIIVKVPDALPENTDETKEDETKEDDTGTADEAVVTDTSYKDSNIEINIETKREYDTDYYIADIKISDVSYLRTALAENTYGRNIKEKTSEIAEAHNAIFAINGDYYGFRNSGYVLRNGELYRDSDSEDALVIDSKGNFQVVKQGSSSAEELLAKGAWQILSFGPALVEDGEVSVSANSEVSQSMGSNPRTAIGQISELHYVVIVSDGRTSESAGLSLLELADILVEKGCQTAYNLDGGGSSTMVFNGEVINNPTSGRSIKEREVSDIVYFGYE